ncbi:MAG: hypothetical protein U5K37_02950 [Natrialbaceae archaeon]|nr:hypothetical protein [Natrialbaceae archaeon]
MPGQPLTPLARGPELPRKTRRSSMPTLRRSTTRPKSRRNEAGAADEEEADFEFNEEEGEEA